MANFNNIVRKAYASFRKFLFMQSKRIFQQDDTSSLVMFFLGNRIIWCQFIIVTKMFTILFNCSVRKERFILNDSTWTALHYVTNVSNLR